MLGRSELVSFVRRGLEQVRARPAHARQLESGVLQVQLFLGRYRRTAFPLGLIGISGEQCARMGSVRDLSESILFRVQL